MQVAAWKDKDGDWYETGLHIFCKLNLSNLDFDVLLWRQNSPFLGFLSFCSKICCKKFFSVLSNICSYMTYLLMLDLS